MYFTLALVISLTFYNNDALAAAGDLDTSFGTNGVATKHLGTDASRSVLVQTDGKIIVVGGTNNGSTNDIALLRFNSDGTLDTSFGTSGVTTTSIEPSANSWGISAALQSDGKIVVVGHYYKSADSTLRMYVARYTANGVLDSTFNADGVATPTIASSTDDRAVGVAIQSDGKIVVAVDSMGGSSHRFVVVRLTTVGDLDPSFGAAGVVTQALSAQHNAPTSIALQADGKILVTGYKNDVTDSYPSYATLRLNTDGSLDNGFGSSGVVVTTICSTGDRAQSVAIQSDGKIVVGGSSYDRSANSFSLVRYTAEGALDPSFNSTGKATTIIATNDSGRALAIQSDGKILLAGYSASGSTYRFALARYTSAGALDTTFNTTGIVTTLISGTDNRGYAAALQGDGKILVAGHAGGIVSEDPATSHGIDGPNEGSVTSFAVARYFAADINPVPAPAPALDFGGLATFGLLLLAVGLIIRRAKA